MKWYAVGEKERIRVAAAVIMVVVSNFRFLWKGKIYAVWAGESEIILATPTEKRQFVALETIMGSLVRSFF